MVCLFHVSVDKANPKRDLLDVSFTTFTFLVLAWPLTIMGWSKISMGVGTYLNILVRERCKKKGNMFYLGVKKNEKKNSRAKKKLFCTFPLCCLLIGERYVGRRKLLGDIDVCDKKSTMRRQDFNGKLCSFFISKF